MEKPFKLSWSLYGHSLDVRSLAVTSTDDIISGSRDKTAKYWKRNDFDYSYSESATYKDQKNYIGSVLFIEPSNDFPEGLVITGGNDNQILIYEPSQPSAIFQIQEHTNAVSCLSKGTIPNTFLSGSWDTTAKYWIIEKGTSSQSSSATLKGHFAAIWSVIQLEDSRVVTASADKDICFWNLEGKLLQTLKGHTDCVRGLCDMPNSHYFLSVSNDATIRKWSYTGENLEVLYGHTNYIYSIARCPILGPDCFVSSDEDRTVRVWDGEKNIHTFQLPAQSIWVVASLNNGDIVTGSSDGVIRIFTQDEKRKASEDALSRYNEEVSALSAQNSQEIGGFKVSDLPGPEALYQPGKKPGQMKMIREPGGVVAYTWIAEGNQGHWEKVGDVLGANKENNENKTAFEGKYYDFVFSVDVEDGKPPLKLPYNKGDDPYVAAQNFLTKNFLPQSYLEQVVDFILKNSKEQYTPKMNNDYVDPFTGGSRYTPGGAAAPQFQGANVDPLTGGSSYSTGSVSLVNLPSSSSGANADPFTGGMSYTTRSSSYFPQAQYLSFDIGNPNVILKKLKEFNSQVDPQSSVNENDLEEFVGLCIGAPRNSNVFDLFLKLLLWPEEMIFPVLDVIRMAVRNKESNEGISSLDKDIVIQRLKYFISEKCPVINNTIVALRICTNLCLHGAGEEVIYENRFDILENVTSLGGLNKNAQVALSTLLINLTVLCLKRNDDLGRIVLTDVIQDIICKLSDSESQFRAYVAIGTLLSTSENKEIKLKLTTNSQFCKTLENHLSYGDNDIERKRMECARNIKAIL